MLPEPAARVVRRYLDRVDAAAPDLIQDFYLVGSIALGGFRAGRSDIDFVATLGEPVTADHLKVLRRAHHRCWADGAAKAVVTRSWPLTCNGYFLADEADLARPPSEVIPVAAQVAERFEPRARFDVNPVSWWILAHHGIAMRGPSIDNLTVHVDDADLRSWTAANLITYWRPWAQAITGSGPRPWVAAFRQLSIGRLVASGVLGTARMHATITTGQVITKERAGDYALATFRRRWHPIIHNALDYWRDLPMRSRTSLLAVRTETVAFVTHVIDSVGAVAN